MHQGGKEDGMMWRSGWRAAERSRKVVLWRLRAEKRVGSSSSGSSGSGVCSQDSEEHSWRTNSSHMMPPAAAADLHGTHPPSAK